jgi:hypothetical protein
MSALHLRFRGLLIALAVLAITAGAVFATTPSPSPSATPTGAQPTAEPTATPTASPKQDGDQDKDKESEKEEAKKTPEPTASPGPGGTSQAAESPAADTHGALVSAAAQMDTPEGFANHGAFVRCVAHMDGTLATVKLTEVTPATCAAAEKARNPEQAQRKADKAAEKAKRQAEQAQAGKGKGAAKQTAKGANN